MPVLSRILTRILAVGAAGLALAALPAAAQTKLKWAHVYEVAEPYHTEALWAADEIKKRTNGKYEIQVFPASQLGNENQINEGLGLAHRRHDLHRRRLRGLDPQADRDHQRALRAARLRALEGLPRLEALPRHRQGLRGQDPPQGDRAELLRPAPRDGEQGDQEARGHEGHEAARAAGAAVPHVHEVGRRQRDADRLRRGLSGAPAGHRRRPGEPAADDHGEEVLRGAVARHADRPHHRVRS